MSSLKYKISLYMLTKPSWWLVAMLWLQCLAETILKQMRVMFLFTVFPRKPSSLSWSICTLIHAAQPAFSKRWLFLYVLKCTKYIGYSRYVNHALLHSYRACPAENLYQPTSTLSTCLTRQSFTMRPDCLPGYCISLPATTSFSVRSWNFRSFRVSVNFISTPNCCHKAYKQFYILVKIHSSSIMVREVSFPLGYCHKKLQQLQSGTYMAQNISGTENPAMS